MKMLIFVIMLALIVSVIWWRVRKAEAARLQAQLKELHRRERQRKKAVSPTRVVEWPVVIRPAGKHPREPSRHVPEPTMTTIEFHSDEKTPVNRGRIRPHPEQGHQT